VATSLSRFRLALPVEVRTRVTIDPDSATRLRHYDYVVARGTEPEALPELRPVARFEEPGNAENRLTILEGRRIRPRPLPSPGRATGAACAEAAFDGRPETVCAVPPRETVETAWTDPVRLEAIAVRAGDGAWPRRLRVEVSTVEGWKPLVAEPLRPTRRVRQSPPYGQTWALPAPLEVTGLRVRCVSPRSCPVSDVLVGDAPP